MLFCLVLGTGFQSKGSYLFGHFSMHLKLVGGDSAGTVTAFYVSKVYYTSTFLASFLLEMNGDKLMIS